LVPSALVSSADLAEVSVSIAAEPFFALLSLNLICGLVELAAAVVAPDPPPTVHLTPVNLTAN